MKARFEACTEFLPGRVGAVGIVGEDSFEALGGGTREFDEFVAHRTMASANALFHAQFLHLLQDFGGWANVGPEDDGINAGFFDHLKLAAKIRVSGHELLLNHNGVAKPPRGIAEFDYAETAVAIVYTQKRNPL